MCVCPPSHEYVFPLSHVRVCGFSMTVRARAAALFSRYKSQPSPIGVDGDIVEVARQTVASCRVRACVSSVCLRACVHVCVGRE